VDNTQQKKTEDAPEMFVKQSEFWFLMVALFFRFLFLFRKAFCVRLVACEFSEGRVQVVRNRLVFLLFTEQVVCNRNATPLIG
jgi:hypothetical protein